MNASKPKLKADVLGLVARESPGLLPHIEADRFWLWYCGPSLAGKDNQKARETLKAAGFSYKINGVHALPSGKAGTWAANCGHYYPGNRRKGEQNGGQGAPEASSQSSGSGNARISAESLALLESLGI